jgi:glucan-binding YG repeat protein
MNEIGGEKIDIILWDEDPKIFITNALSPAKVIDISLNEEEKKATIKVPEDQLSLAIGKSGQNVRLAAKLTGWNVDIEGSDKAGPDAIEEMAVPKPKQDRKDLEAAIIQAVEEQNKNGEAGIKEEKAAPIDKKEIKTAELPLVNPPVEDLIKENTPAENQANEDLASQIMGEAAVNDVRNDLSGESKAVEKKITDDAVAALPAEETKVPVDSMQTDKENKEQIE